MGLGVVRILAQRHLQVPDRFVDAPDGDERRAEVVSGGEIVRTQPQRNFVLADGLGHVAGIGEGRAEAGVRAGVGGPLRRRVRPDGNLTAVVGIALVGEYPNPAASASSAARARRPAPR